MNTDPDYYDVKIAGWWVWGMGVSIPGNWLQQRGLNAMPMLSSAGDNPRMIVILCGYEGDHGIPDTWQTNGGMANQAAGNSRGKDNKASERIWFSPHCLKIGDE
jgi:hypothetical protein